eukprot:705804-Pelagomonas_calceolata.AAC.1
MLRFRRSFRWLQQEPLCGCRCSLQPLCPWCKNCTDLHELHHQWPVEGSRRIARPDDFSLPNPAAAIKQEETSYAAYLDGMTDEEALGMQPLATAAAAQQSARQAQLAKLMDNATVALEAEDTKVCPC